MKCQLCGNSIGDNEGVPMGFIFLDPDTNEHRASTGTVHKRCLLVNIIGEAKADEVIRESQARFN